MTLSRLVTNRTVSDNRWPDSSTKGPSAFFLTELDMGDRCQPSSTPGACWRSNSCIGISGATLSASIHLAKRRPDVSLLLMGQTTE